MRSEERRKELAAILSASATPVSGTELSKKLGVSRQIIVSDISKLRTLGFEILSTHTGYLITTSPEKERVYKVKHTSRQTEEELLGIIELGGTVVDVFVWHKVYGKISAPLNIFSKQGILAFTDNIKSGKSTELMHITSGYHYHTVRAETEEQLDQLGPFLKEKGYIAPEI